MIAVPALIKKRKEMKMIFHVYKDMLSGMINSYENKLKCPGEDFIYIGTEERNVVHEKKIVTKEVPAHSCAWSNDGVFKVTVNPSLPPKAFNIRVSFDVEE